MPDCREKLHERFDVYDTTVDIVSSWESFMSHVYADEFDAFYFDRFPSLPSDKDPKTPDFTVFFNEEYGIIAEIKRTFAEGERAFRAALDQLKGYDGDLPIRNANRDYLTPDVCDILVLISGTASPQIGTRMQRIIVEDEEYSFPETPYWSGINSIGWLPSPDMSSNERHNSSSNSEIRLSPTMIH